MEISACVARRQGGPGSDTPFEGAIAGGTTLSGETGWIDASNTRMVIEKTWRKRSELCFVRSSHRASFFC